MHVRWFVVLLPLLAAVSSPAQRVHNVWDPPFKQGIAAEVEDEIITFEELRREMAPLIPRIREQSQSRDQFQQQMGELYFEVLQNLIDRVLIVGAFHEKEYQIPQTIIEDEFDRVLIEDFDNDRAAFLDFLESQGMTVREFRRDLWERIVVSVMRGEMRRSQSQISPERIQTFYDENQLRFYEEEAVKLRIIMLRPIADEGADQMRQSLERVQQELESGTAFEEVARRFSQDSRRESGGDWGWIQRPDLRDELAEIAFTLVSGEYSEPVTLNEQIFILYAEEMRPEGIQPLSEVRERIEEILASQLARQAQNAWLERLRRAAYVKLY